MICLQVALGTINGLRVASSFHRTQVGAAVVLVDAGEVPDPIMQDAFGSAFLPPSVVRSYVRTLEVHRLSVFDSGNISWYRQQALAEQKAGAFHYTAPPPTLVLNPRVLRVVRRAW